MTVSAPPRPHDPIEAPAEQVEPSALQEEALIEEARHRARRRRRRYGAVALLLLGIVALVGFAIGRDGGAEGLGSKAEAGAAIAPSPRLPHNGPLSIVSAKPGDSSSGGLYEVEQGALGDSVFRCWVDTPCAELEGAAWAPDGKRLVYGAESIGANPIYNGLYVLDIVTGKSRQILKWNSRSERGGWYEPAWSPDGNTIAYVTPVRDCCVGRTRIFLIRADGTARSRLETGTDSAAWPSWSPDGTRIAFATEPIRARGDYDWPLAGSIYVMNIDGSNRKLIARHGTAPAWSPDGTRLAYLSGCGPPPFRISKATGIRIVTPTGGSLTPASDAGCATVGVAGAPAWSPDGTKLAIANQTGVFLTDADGSNLRQLATHAPTSIAGNALSWSRPAWQPLPPQPD